VKYEKNPYIENFCRALVAKKGEKLTEDALDRLIDDLYGLFENMLGRNMVAALPDELRSDYASKYEKGTNFIDHEEISKIFGEHISNPEEIMSKTIKEFADIYFKNR